jgi:hypothetical protein
MARPFGSQMAAGLKQRLEKFGDAVDERHAAVWLGDGAEMGRRRCNRAVLIIVIGVWAILPRIEGLSCAYVHTRATRLVSCEIGQQMHVCIQINDKPQLTKAADGTAMIVVRGM